MRRCFIFERRPVTICTPLSHRCPKSDCEIYPLSAYSLPNTLSVRVSMTDTSRSSTLARVRTKFTSSPFSLHRRCSLKPTYHPMVLLPLAVMPLNTFMLNSRLLCITGIQVLSIKLIPVHSPKQASLRNIVSATKQRGMTSTKRLYENRRGNRCLQCPHTHDR